MQTHEKNLKIKYRKITMKNEHITLALFLPCVSYCELFLLLTMGNDVILKIMFYIKHHEINHLPFTSLHTVTCWTGFTSGLFSAIEHQSIQEKLSYEHIIF